MFRSASSGHAGRGSCGRLVSPFVHLALALIPVWVALLLSYLLGYRAEVLPIAGYCNLLGAAPGSDCGGPVQWAYHLVAPSITLGLALAAVYTELTRRLIRRVGRAVDKQVARRSARIAAAKLVVRNACWLVGATLFGEIMFNLDGLGQEMLRAAFIPDPALGQAVLLVATLVAVGLALVVDLVAAAFVRDWRTS